MFACGATHNYSGPLRGITGVLVCNGGRGCHRMGVSSGFPVRSPASLHLSLPAERMQRPCSQAHADCAAAESRCSTAGRPGDGEGGSGSWL